MSTCWECGSTDRIHEHHVVPRSKGGTRTLPLCEACHGKVHGTDMRIASLTSAAMQHKRSKRELVGAVPYGYALAADGVALVEVPQEQAVIAEVRAMRAAGLSLRRVSRELEARGSLARNGKPFAAVQVLRMMEAP